MRKNNYYMGSLTVEASFIVPAVLFVYVFVIYSTFYMHDRGLAENYAGLMANHLIKACFKNIEMDKKTVNYQKEWEHLLDDGWNIDLDNKQKDIIRYQKSEMQQKLLASRIGEIDVDCSFQMLLQQMQCKVVIRGHMSFPITLFGIDGADFEVSRTGKMMDSSKYLWHYR